MTYTRLNPDSGVGTYKSSWPNAVTLASGTTTDVTSVSLEAGSWVVAYGGSFASNATGQRSIGLSSSSNVLDSRQSVKIQAVGSGETRASGAMIMKPTATTSYHLYASQNSGSSLSFYGWVYAVRVA